MSLAEFVLACIGEREAAVREIQRRAAAVGGDGEVWVVAGMDICVGEYFPEEELGRCAADRRIVEAYREERARCDAYQADDARAVEDDEQAERRRSAAARCRGLEIAVELLAFPYAGRPGYRREWAP